MSGPVSSADPASSPDTEPEDDDPHPDPPYQTTWEDLFISPYTPFLHHLAILEEEGPFQLWCEQRRIYYSQCTHTVDYTRCNNPTNPNRNTDVCDDSCRRPPEYVTYSLCNCPACDATGGPNPQPTATDLHRLAAEYTRRSNESIHNVEQYIDDAQQQGNLTLLALENPEEIFDDPDVLGQEILAELAAMALEEVPRQVIDEYSDGEDGGPEDDGPEGGDPDLENFMEFQLADDPRPDLSEGWVERLPRTISTLTRAQWYGRLSWRGAAQREMGHPLAPYYVPNSASDDTDLLVIPQQPETIGESCAICMVEFGAGDGDDVRRLPCTHLFHYECILRWLYNLNCPVCRRVYVVRRIPRFVDDEGEMDLTGGGETEQTPSPPPPPPPPPNVPQMGGIPLVPGGVRGGEQQGTAPQRAAPQGGGTQGGEPQGGEPQGGGMPIRTSRNRVKLSHPYEHLRNNPGGGSQG
ncbi:hypothetical protein V493_08557 [Pseudogymnoascus sp. VKM F-4281 (FW-2241)]|nr:hypothetical protein V493_08557 [Pseudogymnoascus sp. VKM F-4281 (FW-2241)]